MTMTSAQVPWWWATVLGALAGALSGGFSALLIGSSKAEREERGKRRIDARKEIAKALRSFRYRVSELRLAKFDLADSLDYDGVRSGATVLASTVHSEGQVLSRIERTRLNRDIRRIVGRNLLAAAGLRAPEAHDRFDDSALQAAIATERQLAREALFGSHLLSRQPTEKGWDDLLAAIDRLRRRFP